MNIHAISKGIGLYFITMFSFISFFIFNEFALTERMFTGILLGIIFLVGFYTGNNSGENAGLNGFLIGTLTSAFLIFFISAYTDMQWGLNYFVMIVWTTVSTVGAYAGGKLDIIIKSFKIRPVIEEQN